MKDLDMNDELRLYLMAIMSMLTYANGWLVISVAWIFFAIVFVFIYLIAERKKKANAKKAQH